MRMQVSHRFDADVERVFRLISDPEFIVRKYEHEGSSDIQVDSDHRDDEPRIVSRRRVTIDLPGFAKKVMSPTNTIVQTEQWSPADADGNRVCHYTVEVQGVPSRIEGTVTLTPDAEGTRQDVEAEVKVSIPLLGGRLEKFAVESGKKTLADEAAFTQSELAG